MTASGPSFGAVLDASVLFPAAVRDTLLRAGAADLFFLYWSQEILEEVRRNLVATGRSTEEQAQRLVDTMQRVFPEASVTSYEVLIDSMTNDPKDRHALAAAVVCHAQVIVTDNLRDFRPDALALFNVEAQSADEFLTNLVNIVPERMVQIVKDQTTALRSPPKTYREVLDGIAKQAPTFAALIADRIGGDTKKT